MKKIISTLLVLAMVISCLSIVTFAVDVKTVVNGDAEDSTKVGWSDFKGAAGGTLEQVTPGADGTGHAMAFTASGKWHSIAFNLGAAIIDDEANGYKGGGAGTYTITYNMKAEDGAEGKFKTDINSQAHYNGGTVEGIDKKVTTFLTGPTHTVTDEWEEVSATIVVSEDYLDTIKQLYALGKTEAYDLVLRLDGSEPGYAFEDGDFFTYYIDDVTITKDDEGGSEGTEKKTLTGVKFTFGEEKSGTVFLTSSTGEGGVASAKDVKDGTLTKTVVVKNNSETALMFEFYLEGLVNEQWQHPTGCERITVEAGETETLTYECDSEDGNVTIDGEDVALGSLFFRFNIYGEEDPIEKGTSFTIYCSEAEAEKLLKGAAGASLTKEGVYDKVSVSVGTGDMLPVAFIALIVISSVALVITVKKRKELFN